MYLPFTRTDFKNFTATILIALTIFIALFHFPIFYVGNDSIGLFDVYVVFLFLCIIIRSIYKHKFTLSNWKPLFVAFFASICYYLLRLDYYMITPYKVLLIVKLLEHFFLFFVLIYFLENEEINYPMLMKLIKIILLVLTLFQILDWMRGGPTRDRLSLPFTLTKSPNPAAFILGAALIFFIEYVIKRKQRLLVKLIDIGILVLITVSLLLTLSRTNFIGIILAFALVYFFKGFKDPKRLFKTIVIMAMIIIIFLSAVLIIIETISSRLVRRFAYIVTDPTSIFSDLSFYTRFAVMWPQSLVNWQENICTIFFGKGIAYISVVDGSFFRLLSNQGLTGFLLFIYIWVFFFLKRYRFTAMWILILFMAINAVAADTLVTSYRSIQGYVVLMMMTIYFHRFYHKAEQSKDERLLTEDI